MESCEHGITPLTAEQACFFFLLLLCRDSPSGFFCRGIGIGPVTSLTFWLELGCFFCAADYLVCGKSSVTTVNFPLSSSSLSPGFFLFFKGTLSARFFSPEVGR